MHVVQSGSVEHLELVLVLRRLAGPSGGRVVEIVAAQGWDAYSARVSLATVSARARQGSPLRSVRGHRCVHRIEHEVEELGLAGKIRVQVLLESGEST